MEFEFFNRDGSEQEERKRRALEATREEGARQERERLQLRQQRAREERELQERHRQQREQEERDLCELGRMTEEARLDDVDWRVDVALSQS